MNAPNGLPEKIWLVRWPNGTQHFVTKELLGGASEWAKGTNATVVEYNFGAVAYSPPPPPKKDGGSTP